MQEQDAWTPRRDEAYIGVLIDDLITRGTLEPYRMFTSRAEYRLLLREDNADLRLTAKGRELGLVDDERFYAFEQKQIAIENEAKRLHATFVRPETIAAKKLEPLLDLPLSREYRVMELLKRPNIRYQDLMAIEELGPALADEKAAEQIEIQAKYAGYIDRQEDEIARMAKQESTRIPDDINYQEIISLSAEVRQKLAAARPATVGMASRMPGMTPAAVSLLLVHLKRKKHQHAE